MKLKRPEDEAARGGRGGGRRASGVEREADRPRICGIDFLVFVCNPEEYGNELVTHDYTDIS